MAQHVNINKLNRRDLDRGEGIEDKTWGTEREELNRRADRRDLEGSETVTVGILRFGIGPRQGAARLGYR